MTPFCRQLGYYVAPVLLISLLFFMERLNMVSWCHWQREKEPPALSLKHVIGENRLRTFAFAAGSLEALLAGIYLVSA